MAKAGAILLGDSPGRKVKDKLARVGVTAGGISVLFTLVLIFFFLLYVILPIFSAVKVTPRQTLVVDFADSPALIRLSEYNDKAYRVSDHGQIDVVSLIGANAGKSLGQASLLDDTTSVATALPDEDLIALGGSQGQVAVAKMVFVPNPSSDGSAFSLDYPFGKPVQQLDPLRQPITHLAISVREQRAVMLGVTADNRLLVRRFFSGFNTSPAGVPQWEAHSYEINGISSPVRGVAVTPDAATAYVLTEQKLNVFTLGEQGATLRDAVKMTDIMGEGSQLALLSGANSLLVSDESGDVVSQWFEIVRDGQRKLIKARDFASAKGKILKIVPEYTRKGFFTLLDNGMLEAFYTTSDSAIYEEMIFSQPLPDHLVISPRADRLVAVTGHRWQIYAVDNRHPEIGIASLWQKIWYEGYPEPDYVWQSTSASDEFEPKLSLLPIVFGSAKAALYGLFFAIPLALGGAIYTAYFMSSRMRRVVKPTIELMEALPTVILGFLAAIWLAPIIEENLSGIVLLLVVFPVSMVLAGLGWSQLPGRWRHKVPSGFHILLLIPMIVLVGYGCFSLSQPLENAFFGGDVRVYLTNEWGLGYDQRNSLVVGIAMGFAVIPTIFSIAEDAIFSVPGHLTSGSLALGATHWQTLTRVVLLTASPGIFSAVMMGLGRAVGETMIVLMATGNTPVMDWNVLEGMRTLAATIAIEMPESEVGSSHFRVMFLAAFVLFVFTFIFNTVAELVRQRLRDKYSSL